MKEMKYLEATEFNNIKEIIYNSDICTTKR